MQLDALESANQGPGDEISSAEQIRLVVEPHKSDSEVDTSHRRSTKSGLKTSRGGRGRYPERKRKCDWPPSQGPGTSRTGHRTQSR
eukprot:1589192-Rhodomonas_salina.1